MGMQEYHDGSFGPIKPIDEALTTLLGNVEEQKKTKALHIGQFDELAERVRELSEKEPLAKILQEEVSKLRADMDKVMARLE